MHTDNIFQRSTTKKLPETTMFEISDTKRDFEYSAIDSYHIKFIDFLQDLSFEVEQKYPHISILGKEIVIKGVNFYINTDNASYQSRNAYTRVTSVRKPVNRYISLKLDQYSDNYIIKVHFNKELEVEKLKAKIEQAISETFATRKKHENNKLQSEQNAIAFGNHYLRTDELKKNISYIYVTEGKITFRLKQVGEFDLNLDGSLAHASFHPKDMKSINELRQFSKDVSHTVPTFLQTITEILKIEPVSDELIAWAKKTYHTHLHSETMSTKPAN